MTIQCGCVDQLVTVCAGLVREGIMFEANAATLTVTLTGGY